MRQTLVAERARWAIARVSGPAVEAVSATDVKKHLRVEHTDEDTHISSLSQAAREHFEEQYNRTLVHTTWDYVMDAFPVDREPIELPRPPLVSVTSVKYTTTTSTTAQTVAATSYIVDAKSEPGRIGLKSGATWPTDLLRDINGVEVRYVAGFASTATAGVPQAAKHYIRLLTGHWYVNREAVVVGSINLSLRSALDALGAQLDARRYL